MPEEVVGTDSGMNSLAIVSPDTASKASSRRSAYVVRWEYRAPFTVARRSGAK
jgi:hypothetical protein